MRPYVSTYGKQLGSKRGDEATIVVNTKSVVMSLSSYPYIIALPVDIVYLCSRLECDNAYYVVV